MEDVRKALLLASSQGNIDEVTKIFNAHDIPIDIGLGYGVICDLSPLTVAAKSGLVECTRTILRLGGDLYSMGTFNGIYYANIAEDYTGAIVNAAANGHVECTLMLVEHRFFPYNLKERDESYTKLVAAAKEGDFLRIESLLDKMEHKANVLKGWKGHNIMNMCLLHGCRSSFLEAMIAQGVGVNGWDCNGLTPLMCAILGKNVDCVQYLLHHGADIEATDLHQCRHFHEDFMIYYSDTLGVKFNRTALMYAACMGDIDILKTLLQSLTVEDVNRQEGNQGYFPLLYAVMSGNREVVCLLLENGAEVDMSDFLRRGPLCISVRYGYADLFYFFLHKTKSISQKYEAAVECICLKNIQYLKMLIESCDGAICRDEYEGGLLKDAVSEGSMECAQFLIEECHVQVDVFDENVNALMYCSRYGNDKFVEYLIKCGANLNITDEEGFSSIRKAAKKGEWKCLKLLLDAGADLDIEDIKGGTIFCDILIEEEDGLEMLLKHGALLENGKLKYIHKNGVKSLGNDVNFPLKNILLLMRHNIFEWDWCLQAGYLNRIAFAAVTEGFSPGKWIHYQDESISLVHLALIRRDVYTVRYLLANLYFLPDDFKILRSDWAKSLWGMTVFREVHDAALSLVGQISSQPLSLQTWSFLIISKALCCNSESESSTNRTGKVNSLPLPEGVKEKIKFHNVFSSLCPTQWCKINSEMNDKNLCNLIMDKKPFWKTTMVNCVPECQVCVGLGKKPQDFIKLTAS